MPGAGAPAPEPDMAAGADAFMAPQQAQPDVQAAVQNVNTQARQAQMAIDSQIQQLQGITGTFPLNNSELPGKMAEAMSQLKRMWAELMIEVTSQAPEPQGAPPVIAMR